MDGSSERRSENPLTVVFPLMRVFEKDNFIIDFFADYAVEQKKANIQPDQKEQDMVMAQEHIFLVNELLEFFLGKQ